MGRAAATPRDSLPARGPSRAQDLQLLANMAKGTELDLLFAFSNACRAELDHGDAVVGLVVLHAYSAREKRLEFSDADLSFYGRS